MFPAIRLSTFEETTKPSLLEPGDLSSSILNMGYFYSIGLFQQMSELKKLSSTIFLELEKDFNKLNARVESMQQRIATFKQQAARVIQRNANMSPDEMAQRPCTQNPMPNVSTGQDADLSNADVFVQELLASANPPPTLKPWAPIIPNYQELDKRISDPAQFSAQYKQELLAFLNEAHKQLERKKKKRRVPVDENKTAEKSSIMLHAYTETVAPPRVTLLTPPPKGSTAGWRNKALQEMQAASSSPAQSASVTPRATSATPRTSAPAPKQTPSFQQPTVSAQPVMPSRAAAPKPVPPPAVTPSSNAPPPPPPPPPTAANAPPPPPPPPPGGAPPARTIAPKPSGAPKPKPVVSDAPTHLDLIKKGAFKLKPVKEEPAPVKKVEENTDPNSLSIGELLAKVSKMRGDIVESEDEYSEEEDNSTESW
jgi:hypothetical protein